MKNTDIFTSRKNKYIRLLVDFSFTLSISMSVSVLLPFFSFIQLDIPLFQSCSITILKYALYNTYKLVFISKQPIHWCLSRHFYRVTSTIMIIQHSMKEKTFSKTTRVIKPEFRIGSSPFLVRLLRVSFVGLVWTFPFGIPT